MRIPMFNKILKKSINKSQHCQRNWDLTKQISDEDIDVMKTAVTQCPSKQNEEHYKITIVKDRDKIEKIHEHTKGFRHASDGKTILDEAQTNPQTLANALFVFSKISNTQLRSEDSFIEEETSETVAQQLLSIGIASGYLNLTANLLGYSTGCCTCFDTEVVSDVIGESNPILLMGVGIKDKKRNRLEHHKTPSFKFPSFSKNIELTVM